MIERTVSASCPARCFSFRSIIPLAISKTGRGQAQDAVRRCRLPTPNQARMIYDEYLAKGGSTASGEGGRKNLIQESHQGPDGAFENALDRGNGRGNRPAQSHVPQLSLAFDDFVARRTPNVFPLRTNPRRHARPLAVHGSSASLLFIDGLSHVRISLTTVPATSDSRKSRPL